MTRVKRSRTVVLTGALLVGILLGAGASRASDRSRPQDITRKITLAGADFIPVDPDDAWYNNGNWVTSNSGTVHYTAPVVFPCLPSVTVERIKLHVYDKSPHYNASVTLYRFDPASGAQTMLGQAFSSGSSRTYPRTFKSYAINRAVGSSQRAYVWLSVGHASKIDVYGVTVEYHRDI